MLAKVSTEVSRSEKQAQLDEQIKKRESTWIKKGGKFILPFPKFKLVR